MTLIEVLVALVVVSLGLFAAAKLQWRALQGTDSAQKSSQAIWLAHGVLEHSRSAAGVGAPERLEFQRRVEAFAGPTGRGEIVEDAGGTTVRVAWSDERGGGGWRMLELEGGR